VATASAITESKGSRPSMVRRKPLEDGLGQVLPLNLLAEHVAAVDLLAGVLE